MKIRLGKIFNIPIDLHGSWFVIFIVQTWILANGFFSFQYHFLGWTGQLVLGALTTLLIFGSVLAHELGHAWVAQQHKIRVRSVTLYIFGGIAEIEHEPDNPGAEFWVATAGPLVNLALAGIFWIILRLDAPLPILTAPSIYLIGANLALVLFNLAPGFPLDGGRVLRAILWKVWNNPQRATRVSGYAGRLISVLSFTIGVYFSFVLQEWIDGLWMALIGFFILQAANSAILQAQRETSFSGLQVRQVMQRDLVFIPPGMPLAQALQEWLLPSQQPAFFVTNEAGVTGILTIEIIRQIPVENWNLLNAAQAMKPLSEVLCLTGDEAASTALQTLERAASQAAPVMKDSDLCGLFSRRGVEHFLQARRMMNL